MMRKLASKVLFVALILLLVPSQAQSQEFNTQELSFSSKEKRRLSTSMLPARVKELIPDAATMVVVYEPNVAPIDLVLHIYASLDPEIQAREPYEGLGGGRYIIESPAADQPGRMVIGTFKTRVKPKIVVEPFGDGSIAIFTAVGRLKKQDYMPLAYNNSKSKAGFSAFTAWVIHNYGESHDIGFSRPQIASL